MWATFLPLNLHFVTLVVGDDRGKTIVMTETIVKFLLLLTFRYSVFMSTL